MEAMQEEASRETIVLGQIGESVNGEEGEIRRRFLRAAALVGLGGLALLARVPRATGAPSVPLSPFVAKTGDTMTGTLIANAGPGVSVNPPSPSPPFSLGSNAINQLVPGLRAESAIDAENAQALQGLSASAFALRTDLEQALADTFARFADLDARMSRVQAQVDSIDTRIIEIFNRLGAGLGVSAGIMGVNVGRSPDGANWILTIVTAPFGQTTSGTQLVINRDAMGTGLLHIKSLADLSYATDGVEFSGSGGVVRGDQLTISTTAYPEGSVFFILTQSTILASGTLQV